MGKCKFSKEWVHKFPWLCPVDGDQYRGWCNLCKSSISVKKGSGDVQKHGTSISHLKRVEAETNPEPIAGVVKKQTSIKDALQKNKVFATKQREHKDAALKFEYSLSLRAANHNISGPFIECVVDLVKETITDSAIVKEIKMHRDKSFYLLSEAIAPNIREKVVNCMKKYPYSLNYDESVVNKKSQLALNASFRNEQNLIQKANIGSIEITSSATGKYICDKTYEKLESLGIPSSNQVSDQTDGCSVMLGRFQGCHENAKKVVPTLPDLGGCNCHDPSNAMKAGLKIMMPDMTKLYKSIYANLEKHSIVKNRLFREIGEELGILYKHVPKYIDVRFRYVPLVANYILENDRALYVYYKDYQRQVQNGKSPSETEKIILDTFLGNYIEVRLTNLFLVEVCQPMIDFIDFFESRKVRCHLRYPKMAILLSDHLARFVKEDISKLNPRELINVKTKEENILPVKDIVLGSGVTKFMKEMDMTVDSPEMKPFLDSVVRFYVKSSVKLQTYFETPLKSKTLKYLDIISPKSKNLPLSRGREVWGYLGHKFPNIISEDELQDLLNTELPRYASLEDPEDGILVDEWWAQVAEVEVCEEKFFKNLPKLALGLATIYNSSSEAERDISKLNNIFAGNKKGSIKQETVEDKLTVQAAVSEEGKYCKRCIENDNSKESDKNEGKKVGKRVINHCHCGFLKPDKSVLDDMRNCVPAQQYREKLAKKVPTDHDDLERKKAADSIKAKEDLKNEVIEFKKTFKEKAAKEKNASAVTVGVSEKNSKKHSSKKAPVEKESNPNKRKKLMFID